MAERYKVATIESETTPGLHEVHLSHIPELEEFVIPSVEFTGKQLGKGAFGSVEEVRILQSVCIRRGFKWCPSFAAKLLHCPTEDYDSMRCPLIKECFLMNEARHHNLVEFLGISYKPGEAQLPALIMEQLETSLHDKLLEQSKFHLEQRITVLLDVSKGLSYLHSMSPPLCHRDLTAKNILLSSDGVAKIADFGMAKVIKVPTLTSSFYLTKNPGNVFYMPPEVSQSPTNYNISIDVFSFGVVALFAGTKQFPALDNPTYFDKKTNRLIARTEIERRQSSLKQLSKSIGKEHPLNALVKQCLEYQPQRRPSAKDLQENLLTMLPRGLHTQYHKRKLKIVLLGNSGVGKTALLKQFVGGKFRNNTLATVGMEISEKCLQIDDKTVHTVIWDSAGQERYHAIVPIYCRNADACLLVYKVNEPSTLRDIDEVWLPILLEYSPDAECILVGNRIDEIQSEEMDLQYREAKTFAERKNMAFIMTSAKTSLNVEDAFGQVIRGACRKAPQIYLVDEDKKTLTDAVLGTSKRCLC